MIADSVRLALPGEAEAIATVQRRAWTALEPGVGQALLSKVDLAGMTEAWRTAITRPPLAQHRVLVAVGSGRIVGFAAVGPAADPDATPGEDGEVLEFVVDPPARRQGHGSRMLHAVVDTLRADGFSRAQWWLRSVDDDLRAFLTSTGWGPDGAHASIEDEDTGTTIKLVRLHTDIRA